MNAIRLAILSAALIGCANPDAVLNPPDPVEIVQEQQTEWISLGEYKLTAYCPCERCCGKGAKGITASGTVATAGRTIGVNPKVIPYGTEVMIDNHIYVAEDTGGGIRQNHIDVYYDSHAEALAQGVLKKEVFMRNGKE